MAEASEIRARLRAAGIEVPTRGRISEGHMAEFDKLTAEEEAAGVTTAAAGPPPPPPEAEAPPAPPGQVEVRPSRPRAASGKSLADTVRSLGGRDKRKAGGSRAKAGTRARTARPAHERVSVSGLIGWGWGIGARAAAPLSRYLSQCLAIQAPVAGKVLEDQVRGTVVDRVLQPLARGQARLEGVGALVLLPMAIAALEASEGLPEPKRSVRRAFLIPIAREGAALWIRIAGPKVEELVREEAEKGPVYAQADALLVMMDMPFLTADDLGVTVADAAAAADGLIPVTEDEARDMAARAAQGFAGG